MRKQVFGRKFKRDKNERKALFSGLISAMILNGRIETTEEKAKAIRGDLERLVTKAKRGESSKRLLQKDLKTFEIDKMINQIGPSFANRLGGYTRIIKIGRRFNDNAGMAILEWTEKIQINNEKLNIKKEKTKEPKKIAKPVRKQSKEKIEKTVRKSSSKGKK